MSTNEEATEDLTPTETLNPRRALAFLIGERRTRGLDPDSAGATAAHTLILREKPFLRRLYARFYAEFARGERDAPPGLRVEVGSGSGFLREVVPGLVRVDLRAGARVEVVASALALPFKRRSVGALFMLNVLHHLPDVETFFSQVSDVLVPGGRAIVVEPYVSTLSRIVYGFGHPEPFAPDQCGWRLESRGAMTTANDALPWIVFCRDRERFERLFPDLEILRVRPHTIALYVISGGFSYRSLAPGFMFPAFAAAEDLVSRVPGAHRLASMMTVELASRKEPGSRRVPA